MQADRPKCAARIRYRGKLRRYTGRTSGGFEREWTWRQCSRRALPGYDLCGTHRNVLGRRVGLKCEGTVTTTETHHHPLSGLSLDRFLDRLPAYASVVSGGEWMRGASDAEIQAWAWGIADTAAQLWLLIAEWRSHSRSWLAIVRDLHDAHAADPPPSSQS